MSNIVTKWVLELSDKMSGPIKAAQERVKATGKEWAKVGEHAGDSLKTISEQLKIEEKDLKEYQSALKRTEAQAYKMGASINKMAAGSNKYKQAKKDLADLNLKAKQYQLSISETEKEIMRLASRHDQLASKKKSWDMVMLSINQTIEVAQKLTGAMSYGEEIAKTGTLIEQMTGITGGALTDLKRKSFMLSEQFGEDQRSIAQAANAMSKGMGISFTDALEMIETGYHKGANINGDMLDQIKEYSAQMHQAGLSAGEMLAVMADAGKQGVFSDKAMDSLKEANLSIREMGQTQIDALNGIGLSTKDLAGKTTMEIVQMMSKAMNGKSVQAQQKVIADVFKGAGEDAGAEWIKGLGSVNMDVEKIPSVLTAGNSLKRFLASVKFGFADTFSAISTNATTIGAVASTVGALVPIYNALATSTKLAAAAQWLMNAAAAANPYVLLGMAIVALIAGIVALVVHYEEVTGWMKKTWEEGGALTKVFMILGAVLLAPIAPIMLLAGSLRWVIDHFEELNQIVDHAVAMIAAFATGDLKNAAEAAKSAGKKIAKLFGGGYDEEMSNHKPVTIMDRIQSVMKRKNGSIVSEMIAAGKRHGNSYVDAKIKQAEKWAAYMDKIGKTDIYSKKVASAKEEYFKSRKEDKARALDGEIVNTGKSNGLAVTGSSLGKGIIMNLKFDQHFHAVKGGADVGKIADEVAGLITDRLRDALVSS